MIHRYLMGYVPTGHCVRDSEEKLRVVFSSGSKSQVIRRCQELNGFVPADGSEQTYAEQVAASNRKEGKC